MKITGIETFVVDTGFVDTGFTPRRPWLFSAVRQLRRSMRVPICSGEQLLTVRQYRPYFDHQAMDVVMVDAGWQGFSAAKKVADLAEVSELNIAPHNYNRHLSTFLALNLCASVSTVKIMESDPDAVPCRDGLFTVRPEIHDGHMTVPTGPGWGTDLNEAAARRRAWTGWFFSSGGGGSRRMLAPAMRVTEERPPRLTLDVRSLRRSQPPPAASDDAPFGAFIGAFIGILISVPLWVLIGIVIVLLRG